MTMAAHLWPLDPAQVDNNYSQRHPDEPLPRSFMWATWTAAGSDYLNTLDAASDAPHDGGLIDISHVRWATMNAITAIDLGAATLGRMFCGVKGSHELDLRAFDRNTTRADSRCTAEKRMAQLTGAFPQWVEATLNDPDYKTVLALRNPLTHSDLRRGVFGVVGVAPTHRDRTAFFVTDKPPPINAREAVVMSANLALGRVRAFIEVVDQH